VVDWSYGRKLLPTLVRCINRCMMLCLSAHCGLKGVIVRKSMWTHSIGVVRVIGLKSTTCLTLAMVYNHYRCS
jgi:hypothetical protein